MEENIRINKILRRLDISLKRAVDFLNTKNIKIQESPNTKISEHACKLLVNQFCLDNTNKIEILSYLLDKNNEEDETNRMINTSTISKLTLNEHREFLIIDQKERSTILKDALTGFTYPYRKISKLVGDSVLMQVASLENQEKPILKYSVLNDFVVNEEYEFDIVEKKEKGYVIENSEDYSAFIPFSYEKHILNNKKIFLTIDKFDLERNTLLFKQKESINNVAEVEKRNFINPSELFVKGEKYNFNVEGITNLVDENISIFLLEYKGFKATVKAFSFQSNDNLPESLSCIVTLVTDSKVHLAQDRFALLSTLYNEGNQYDFTISSLEHDSNTNTRYYIISDKYGFTHKLYNNGFDNEEFESLQIGDNTSLYLRRIDEKGYLVLNETSSSNHGIFISAEAFFEYLNKSEFINKYFYDFKDEIKKDIYKELPFSQLFDDYDKKENLWIFSYLSLLDSFIQNNIHENKLETALEFTELYIKIEEWMLEGSDFLQKFSLEKRPFIIKKAESQLENAKVNKEALLLIMNDKSEGYIQDVLKKLRLSGYLMGNTINVFKTIILNSNETILKKTNEIIEIILLLIKNDLLNNYDINKFIDLLQNRINIEKYELNPSLLNNKSNSIDNETINALINIIKVLGLQIILYNKNKNIESNKATLKSALLCRYLSILSENENDKIELLNGAIYFITTGTTINLSTELIRNFKLNEFKSIIKQNSKKPITDSLKGYQIFKHNGAIYSTQNGWAIFSKQQINQNLKLSNSDINPIISFFNNQLCVASHQKLDLRLSYNNNIDLVSNNWDTYYKFEYSNRNKVNNSNDLYLGQKIRVYAKNYLKGVENVVFLKITESNFEGEGLMRLADIFKSLDSFDEIINPGDELNVEIVNIDERGILFSLSSILKIKTLEEISSDDVVDAKVIKIFGTNVYLITENGHFAYFDNDSNLYDIEERKVYKFKIKEIDTDEEYMSLKYVANSDRNFNEKLVLRNFLERKGVIISNDLEYEIDNSKNFNLILQELVNCIENIMHLEKENMRKMEYLQLLKLLTSITKNVKSYYFQTLIKYYQNIYLFKDFDYGNTNLNFELIDEKTLSYFKSLELINDRYRYLNFYNKVDSISELMVLRNEVLDDDELKLLNMLLAHNLLISDNPDEIILKRTKDLIFEFLSNEKVNTFDNLINSIGEDLIENVDTITEELEEELQNLGKEGTYREFKTSIVYYAGTSKQDFEKQSSIIMKTIAGFLNSKGGSLFIGVNDSGEIVGLQNDYSYFGKSTNSDKFEREIRAIIVKSFNKDVNSQIEFKFLTSKNIEYCEIIIPSYDKPVSYNDNFYQRQGNETRIITGNDLVYFFERKLQKTASKDNNLIFNINKEQKQELNINKYSESDNQIQVNLFEENIDFYSDQKSDNNNLSIDYNIATDSILAYMYIYINGKYVVSTKKIDTQKLAEEIIIYNNFKNGFLLQCYDNGCVNKVEVRTILGKTLGRIYSNGFSLQGNLIGLFLIQEDCLLQVSTIRNDIEYIKIVDTEIISTHNQLNLKGNNIVQEDFDLVNYFKIIDKSHKENLNRITYKSKQSLGVKINKITYKSEIDYLSKI